MIAASGPTPHAASTTVSISLYKCLARLQPLATGRAPFTSFFRGPGEACVIYYYALVYTLRTTGRSGWKYLDPTDMPAALLEALPMPGFADSSLEFQAYRINPLYTSRCALVRL